VLGVLGAGMAVRAEHVARDEARHAASAALTARNDSVLELDIEFYEARATLDPYSAGDRTRLALLFLERARRLGDIRDAQRAETMARASYALRSAHNGAALSLLISSLLEQHRFIEARDVARALVARDTSEIEPRALLAETELELGDYSAAGEMFRALRPSWGTLAVAPRLARYLEIIGRLDGARLVLTRARETASRDATMSRGQLAWFDYRLGDFELRAGRLPQARTALERGLEIAPDDHHLLSAMARLEFARGRWRQASAFAERSIAVVPDPAVLGLLADAATAMGDTARTGEYVRANRALSLGTPGPIHRAWSLFWLDRGEHVAEVLARAIDESRTRHDVYGDDVLSWALHKAGRNAEALVVSRRAIAQGTRDASMLYHAGMIEQAAGNHEAAQKHLELALATNPHFHPGQAAEARTALQSLARRVASR